MGTVRIGGVVKNSPSTQFWLEADWVRQDQGGNYSVLGVWLRAANGPSGSTSSSFNGEGYQNAHADGYMYEHRGNPFLPGGYGQNQTRWHDYQERIFYHDGEGYRGGVGLAMELGYGSISDRADNGRAHYGSIGAPPRIPKPPAAPSITSVVNVGTNTFGVNYNRGDNRGAGIEQDHAEWSLTNGNVVWNDYGPGGYTSPNGGATPGAPALTPGTTYRVRVRSRNAAGWGAWSGYVSQTTLPASPPGIAVVPSVSGRQTRVTLSAPGGVSGVNAWIYEYRDTRPGGGPIVQIVHNGNILDILNLTPGITYQYRGQVRIGDYYSPQSAWVTATQPAPNTNPGSYFDGDTEDKVDTAYAWLGTPGKSRSQETGVAPDGWMQFGQGNAASGGTGVVVRVTGGRGSAFAARTQFFTDTQNPGFITGVGFDGAGAIEEGAPYWGSIYLQLFANSRWMQPGIAWYTEAGVLISYEWDDPSIVLRTEGSWTRLSANGTAPEGARFGAPVVRDFNTPNGSPYGSGPYGSGPYGGQALYPWTPWLGGDAILLDNAMMTLTTLFDYFDGSTPDTPQFQYDWLGLANASGSSRTTLEGGDIDPLADPDCPPVPTPPAPPSIDSSCIIEVGTWRRYWAQIPEVEISQWLAVLPTLHVTTANAPARQVRIRYYPNPEGVTPDLMDPAAWNAEQILSYIPPNTTVTLDGPDERVRARVGDAEPVGAGHLLYGTGGTPATWPILSCGIGYLISFDVPLDAPVGNETIAVELTQRQ